MAVTWDLNCLLTQANALRVGSVGCEIIWVIILYLQARDRSSKQQLSFASPISRHVAASTAATLVEASRTLPLDSTANSGGASTNYREHQTKTAKGSTKDTPETCVYTEASETG
jgi:hypothetical protein